METIRNREAETQARLDAEQGRLATANEAARTPPRPPRPAARPPAASRSGRCANGWSRCTRPGSPELLDVLIGEGDLEDVEAQAEYLDAIHRADEAAAGRVRDLRDGVALTVERRAAAKGEIEHAAQRDRRRRRRTRRHPRRSAGPAGRAGLGARRSRSGARPGRHHETELDGDVEAIQGKIAEELAATGSMPLPLGAIKAGSGSMIWPVDGPIASPFGPRTIEGHYEYHPGIDIAVPEGTPIRAALTGTVAFTEPEAESGGYGNYTCIDHGGGLSTCYAHQSAFAVSAGRAGATGRGDRLLRLHRVLPWTPCPLRGSYKWRSRGPVGLSLVTPVDRDVAANPVWKPNSGSNW